MKPLILITNDDGIYSPGLTSAAEALEPLGELLIVAPRFQQTGMSRSFPKGNTVGKIDKINLLINGKLIPSYGVYGSPAQAVAHGILELAPRTPDICISGINYGENLGLCLTCSGTLGAAFEAHSHGICAVAISREADWKIQHSSNYQNLDFNTCKKIACNMTKNIITNGFPRNVDILNINIPDDTKEECEIRITKQSRSNYSLFKKPESRDFNQGFRLESEIKVDLDTLEKDSDVYAFYIDKVISITPLVHDLSYRGEISLHCQAD